MIASLGVEGSTEDREAVSRRLEGHPLALRVFAAALARQPHRDPARLITAPGLDALGRDDPLQEKVAHLLAFYEASLSPVQRTLLGGVGLFPGEVDLDTVKLFARELPGAGDCLRDWSDNQLRLALDELVVDGLLTRVASDKGGPVYACHPVVRDRFRAALIGDDGETAGRAADLLTGALTGEPETAEQVRTVVHAIRLLLEVGLVAQADELTGSGSTTGVSSSTGCWYERGWSARCCSSPTTRAAGGYGSSALRVGWPSTSTRSESSHFLAAELELAERYYRDGVEFAEQAGNDRNLAIRLANLAVFLVLFGQLVEAEAAARRALALAERLYDEQLKLDPLVCLALVLDRQGRTAEAVSAFEHADKIRRRLHPAGAGLFGMYGTVQALLLLRLGRRGQARQSAAQSLATCEQYGWRDNLGRALLLLGRLDMLDSDLDAAAVHLRQAEATIRHGHLLCDLPRVLIAQAGLFRQQHAWGDA